MKVEVYRSWQRRWWRESGVSSFGFGIEIRHHGEFTYSEDDQLAVNPEGWEVDVHLGPWSLVIYTAAAHRAIYGDEFGGSWFEVVRP
jgi:hypothetical protein